MKIFTYFVEKIRIDKAFRIKASLVVGLIMGGVSLGLGMSNGVLLKDALIVAVVLAVFWFFLFWAGAISLAKSAVRIREQKEEREKEEKEEKKRQARQRAMAKEEELKRRRENRKKKKQNN